MINKTRKISNISKKTCCVLFTRNIMELKTKIESQELGRQTLIPRAERFQSLLDEPKFGEPRTKLKAMAVTVPKFQPGENNRFLALSKKQSKPIDSVALIKMAEEILFKLTPPGDDYTNMYIFLKNAKRYPLDPANDGNTNAIIRRNDIEYPNSKPSISFKREWEIFKTVRAQILSLWKSDTQINWGTIAATTTFSEMFKPMAEALYVGGSAFRELIYKKAFYMSLTFEEAYFYIKVSWAAFLLLVQRQQGGQKIQKENPIGMNEQLDKLAMGELLFIAACPNPFMLDQARDVRQNRQQMDMIAMTTAATIIYNAAIDLSEYVRNPILFGTTFRSIDMQSDTAYRQKVFNFIRDCSGMLRQIAKAGGSSGPIVHGNFIVDLTPAK